MTITAFNVTHLEIKKRADFEHLGQCLYNQCKNDALNENQTKFSIY